MIIKPILNKRKKTYSIGKKALLRLPMNNAIITMSGTINTATGHSGRLRSCSMATNTTIAKGTNVILSSSPPMK